MPTLHSTLTGADLHEVKGASSATAGQVYRADGIGSAGFVNPTSLTNIQYASTLTNFNSAAINPSVVDVAITAGFDATVFNADVNLNSSGLMTILSSGLFDFTFNANIGRANATGNAIVATRLLINGTQFGFTQASLLATNQSSRPVQFRVTRAFNTGDTVQVQVMRDSAGNNDGGFLPQAITLGTWGDGPSYFVRVSKILGGA